MWWPFSRQQQEESYPWEDIKERQERLDEARMYVNKWADEQKDPSRSFCIHSAERMAIVNEVLIQRASHEVVFAIERIRSEEFGTRQILRAVYDFLDRSRPDGTITFFVDELAEPEPGSILATILGLPRVQVIHVDFPTCKHHFAVVDGRHYWFEINDSAITTWFGKRIKLDDYRWGMFNDPDMGGQFQGMVALYLKNARHSQAA